MAIYHLHAKMIQRSKGKNVVASAAYRHAARMVAEKEGLTFDYTNKKGVIHTEILIPKNSPEWLQSLVSRDIATLDQVSEKLWNLVENIENRKDAQLAREIEFSLPIELTQEQNIRLAREFIEDQFVLRGMVADFAIHWDEGNPHVHTLLSTRQIGQEGFGQKVTEWNSKVLFQEWRQKWAEYANFHLRMHQHTVRIDHRSYEEQGIALIPSVHQGKAVTDMERRGIKTEIMTEANWAMRENLARICAAPDVLLNKVTSQNESFTLKQVGQELGRYINDQGNFSIIEKRPLDETALADLANEIKSANVLTPEIISKIFSAIEHHESVFTDRDLAKALAPHTQNAEMFAEAVLQIKSSSDLIRLGPGDDGRDRYTTRKMFDLENELQKQADILRNSLHVKISSKSINEALTNYQNRIGKQLTGEQRIAVKHILKSSSISCIVGRAGTGKSFLLGAARDVWEAQGLKVLGVALSGIAADGLSKDANIDSRTIESFRYAIQKGKVVLNSHTVVVMDEAGMTDSHSMLSVLSAVREARAKLVLVGDHEQIQPVGPGASFRALLERLGFAEIQTVYRQNEQWQRDATVAFSAGKVDEGLAAYAKKGCIHISKAPEDAMGKLVDDWLNLRSTHQKDPSQYLVVAHRNEDVLQLNQRIRAERVGRGEISEGYSVQAKASAIKIAKGDRLLFLKNDRRLGVSNGRFATIQSVSFTESGKAVGLTVVLDGSLKEVRINPEAYNDFALGYAATVHKVQGMTVDHAFVYAGGKSWNRHLTYVAMSRHRDTCHLYADQETHRQEKDLNKNLSRLGIKDSLLDYPLAFAERRGIDTSGLLNLLPQHLVKRLAVLKEQLADRIAVRVNPTLYKKRQEEKINNTISAEERAVVREDARRVAAYVDLNQDVGMGWETAQRKINELGFDTMPYDAKSFDIVAGTKEYQSLKNALNQRNAIAADIVKEPERYKRAIELYHLDLDKLKAQAESHVCLTRVQEYIQHREKDRVVHRDRLAALISSNIKSHYPHLKALGVDTKALRQEAIWHLRQKLFITLTEKEREAFHTVEKYRDNLREVGAYYARHIKPFEIVAREHAIHLETLGRERDRLAYEILQSRSLHDKALDFYQIGLAVPYFQETPTAEHRQKAEERWYKLQGFAARHEFRDRITQYFEADKHGLVTERLKLASAIRKESKAHYAAMMQLGIRPEQSFWLQIWKDEERYKQLEFFKTLDLVERAAFSTVESYVDAKRSNATAWKELFEIKKVRRMDDVTFYAQLAGFADGYTKQRNALAAKIASNPAAYQASLDYFKINADELNTAAYTHQCQDRVESFAHDKSVLVRAEIALSIIQNPKAHYKAMATEGIQWRDVYHFARIAERKNLFRSATHQEKQLMRLIENYKTVSRQVGKCYSHLKEKQIHNPAIVQNKLQECIGKRDWLAHRIMNIKENMTMMSDFGEYRATQGVNESIEKSRFSWEKVAKHAERHIAKQQTLLAWHADYAISLNQLVTMMAADGSLSRQNIMSRIIDWSADRKDRNIDVLTQKILAQGKEYGAVLQESGIHLNQLIQQQKNITQINDNLWQWLSLEDNKNQVSHHQKIINLEDQNRINVVRKIVRESKPIKGTLGERYLREYREIKGDLNTKTFLYHPNLKNWMTKTRHPALIILARDKNHEICGLQAIFLDPRTAKKAALGDFTKLSRGFTSEGGLVQAGKPGGKIAFAEGPETALSIAEAKPDWTVYVTFGVRNFDKVPLKTNANSIVICADNDGPRSGTEKSVEEAASKLSKRGIDVYVAMPDKPTHAKKWDFNDALTAQGIDQIVKNLDQAKLNQKGNTFERLQNAVMQTVASITQKKETTNNETAAKETRIVEMYDIKSIIKRYVEVEIMQISLVNEMHAARMKDPTAKKEASAKAIKHGKEVAELAKEIIKNPEVASELEHLKRMKPAALATRGGYVAINTRFAKDEFLVGDIQTVLAEIRKKAFAHSEAQTRDKGRGGRSY